KEQQQQHLYQQFLSFQPFQPFRIGQPLYAASQYNYGRGALLERGSQTGGRGGIGRGAFGSNFIPLEGQ
ncbi:MAG: hypothetical protein EZS28_022440, partial [Streblomastix strix]